MSPSVEGKSFEDFLHINARLTGWNVIQLPAGAKFIGRGKVIPIKCPFDFIFQKDGNVIFCDAKTTNKNSFSYSSINQNQVKELEKLSPLKAGYIVEFRDKYSYRFYSVKSLADLRPRQSLSYTDGIELRVSDKLRLELLFDCTKEGSKNVGP